MELLSCKERHFQLWLVDFLSAKGLIKFKQVVFAHTLDNQMVSNSVFKVTQIIYIVRFKNPDFTIKLDIDISAYYY